MLQIHEQVKVDLLRIYSDSAVEKGVLLGCTTSLNRLEKCCALPARQAGLYFYTPNTHAADEIIRTWSEQGICFCGLIHSHITEKDDLSDADIVYANKLIKTFTLPVLWFGLALVHGKQVVFRFYAVTNNSSGKTHISPVRYAVFPSERRSK